MSKSFLAIRLAFGSLGVRMLGRKFQAQIEFWDLMTGYVFCGHQAEFMEHDEKPIPIDIRTLGALAEKVRYSWVFMSCTEVTFPPYRNGCVAFFVTAP